MIIQKQYARRSLVGYTSPYVDPFRYVPILELPQEEVLQIFHDSVFASCGRDVDRDADFQHCVKAAREQYDPSIWMIVYLEDEPVGIVFPQRIGDAPELGSVYHIGLMPKHRGKGYGKILHAKAMQLLAEKGLEKYLGSTDVKNAPMIKIFQTNGCELHTIRWIKIGVGEVSEEEAMKEERD